MIMCEFQSTKTFLLKDFASNWSVGLFVISKTKNRVPWIYIINDLNEEEIIEIFYEK